ncbi:MAG: hypothetical protein JRJ39_00175 [Deltaproteobacteria bacterium]|nr:hypothetical protein [Deltaproteobacteria bacterium]
MKAKNIEGLTGDEVQHSEIKVKNSPREYYNFIEGYNQHRLEVGEKELVLDREKLLSVIKAHSKKVGIKNSPYGGVLDGIMILEITENDLADAICEADLIRVKN